MMLGHKSKDDVTEEYIRVSDEMRLRFYDYVELIVGEKSAERGSSLRLFKDISTLKPFFTTTYLQKPVDFWESLKHL